MQPGTGEAVGKALMAQVKRATVAAALGGCQVAAKALQGVPRRLPSLKYHLRDRPHAAQTATKGILKYTAEGPGLLPALISGKGSLAKRAPRSRRSQKAWLLRVASQPDLLTALRCLSQSGNRLGTRSEPMSILALTVVRCDRMSEPAGRRLEATPQR